MNIGERVSGRYKIIDTIGSGGMANVYLAEDLILEREVAVKMMALDFQDDEDNLRRFQREALSTTELIHPNIVNIYDVGEKTPPYIVMEYVDGTDLKQHIQTNHPIPHKKVINIMQQVLNGISYAHANGVIHRDIKPHNMLMDAEGNIKITDFGIAVALSQNSITQTNSLLGSVQYISPEQARGNVVTKQSDIYSLGIVLYEMLTGSVPFEGESAVSIALKHFQTPIPSLREMNEDIPQPLENVVLKATAKEPRDRYENVDEMKADLETVLAPSRKDEPKFVPTDPSDEDTLVMQDTVADVKKATAATPPKINKETTDEDNQNQEDETDEEEPKKRRWWWLLLIPLLILLVIGMFFFSRPQQIDIPNNLVGMTYEEAVAALDENSLILGKTVEQANDEIEEGVVFETDPSTGATVREGAEVDLYVSLGEEPYSVEDYTDASYEEVRAELTELGFTVESEEEPSESTEEGDIIDQSVEAGEEVVASETTITFTVSSGRPVIPFRDLSGYSRASVEDFVDQHNLNLITEEESSDEVPLGQVISQDPEPGTSLYAGDQVTVVFSTGPEEISTIAFSQQISIPYEDPTADDETTENGEDNQDQDDNQDSNQDNNQDNNQDETTAEPNEIQIYKDDLENNMDTVAHELTITEDTSYFLNFIVEEGNSASYRVDRDGETIIEETVSPN